MYGGDDGKDLFERMQGKLTSIIQKRMLMEERLSYSGMKLQSQKWMMNLKRRHHQRSENPLKTTVTHFKVAIKSLLCLFKDISETKSVGRRYGVIVCNI